MEIVSSRAMFVCMDVIRTGKKFDNHEVGGNVIEVGLWATSTSDVMLGFTEFRASRLYPRAFDASLEQV